MKSEAFALKIAHISFVASDLLDFKRISAKKRKKTSILFFFIVVVIS
jgi:hypothetical protein